MFYFGIDGNWGREGSNRDQNSIWGWMKLQDALFCISQKLTKYVSGYNRINILLFVHCLLTVRCLHGAMQNLLVLCKITVSLEEYEVLLQKSSSSLWPFPSSALWVHRTSWAQWVLVAQEKLTYWYLEWPTSLALGKEPEASCLLRTLSLWRTKE